MASSIRRTDVSLATASGMNELGKRTVSRRGRIGSSSGRLSGRSVESSSTSRGSSRSLMMRGRAARMRGAAIDGLSIRHVEEERGRSALAREHALALFGGFTRLFAILAANGKRQRPQSRLGDFVAALEAVAVRPVVQPAERLVDLVERLRFHLDEREFDVLLNVDFRALALVENITLLATVSPHVANFALHFAQQLAAALLEHLLQFVIAAGLARH